jgi:hypothetical protein
MSQNAIVVARRDVGSGFVALDAALWAATAAGRNNSARGSSDTDAEAHEQRQ